MTTFVLILTLLTGYAGVVSNVSGFNSLEECQAAGQAWAQSTKSLTLISPKTGFVCVEQKK